MVETQKIFNILIWLLTIFASLGIIASGVIKLRNLEGSSDVWEYVFNLSLILIVVQYGIRGFNDSLDELKNKIIIMGNNKE